MLVEGLHLTDIGTIDIVTNVLKGATVFMSPDLKPSNDKKNALATLVHNSPYAKIVVCVLPSYIY